MGVKGLWSVLEPSSQPVRLEALSGQRIAIDASIWLNQFVKALHDKDGNPLDQAHIIGFYRRICKLLYFGVKPVFVFDGNAPELKRKVIAERRRRGQDRSRNIRRDANRLLALQLQKQALDNAQPGATSPSPHQQKRKGGSGITKPRDLKRKKDEFELSSFDGPEESRFIAKAADDERLPLREEIREFVSNQAHEFSHDVEFDIEDPDFLALPQDIQTELLRALKNQSRRTSYERLQHMLETSRDAYDFSQQQIQNLVRRNDLMQKYFVVSGAHSRVTDPKYLKSNNNLEFSRVAAERDTHYMLVKDEERGAGWVFSRTNNQEQPAEDDTIPSITSNGLKGMNNEGQDQGQHDDDDNDDDDSDVWAQGSQTPAQTGSYDGNYVTISSASSDSFDTDIIIPDNPDNPCEPSIIGANDDKYFPEDAYRPQPPPVPPSTIQQDAWYLQQQHYYYQQQQQYHHQPQSRPQAQSRPQQAFQESHVTNQDLNSMLSSLSADEFLTAMIQMVPQQIIRLVPGIIDQMEAMMDPEDICEEDLEEMHSRFQRRLEKRPEADFPALIEQATDLIRLINVSNGQRRSDMDALADLGSESGGDDSDNYEKADRKAGSTVNAAADAAEKSNAIYADKTFKRSLETAHMEIMVAFMGYLIEWRLRHPRTSSSDAGSKGRGRNKSLLFLSAVSPNIDQIDGYRRGDKGLAARETPDGSSEGPSAKTEVPLPQDAAIPVSILRAKSSPPADEGGDNAVELAGPGIHDDIEVVANTELIYDK
ncbi:DNA repair protein rad2, partial [Spiromyces aspiralis]